MLKIGIIGAAEFARNQIIPVLSANKNFNIAAIATRNTARIKQTLPHFKGAILQGYDSIMDWPLDAIYIPLVNSLHFEYAQKALRAGKHVLVEKPLALSPNQTQQLIETAEKQQLCLFENFMFTYHHQIQYCKQLIAEQKIGEIKLMRSIFAVPPFQNPNNFRYNPQLGGGALLDAGVYPAKACQLFLGQQQVISSTLNAENKNVDMSGTATLINKAGVVSQISFSFNRFYTNCIEITGTHGRIRLNRAFTAKPDHSPQITIETPTELQTISLPPDNQINKLWNDFYDKITTNRYGFYFQDILQQAKLINDIKKQARHEQ